MLSLKRLIRPLTVLLVLAVPGTALAATYWVSPTGTAGKSGADSLSNATTLAWFNANAGAGDICRFRSGTYSDPVYPNVNGTASSRVRYYGFPQDPTAVVVADIHFGYQKGSYCTARWLKVNGEITGCYEAAATFASNDSIVRCVGTGGGIGLHSKSTVFDSLSLAGTATSTGQTQWVDLSGERDHYNGTIGEWAMGSTNNQLSNSTINLIVNTTSGQGDVHGLMMSACAYNKLYNNTFNITVNACFGYFFALEQYEGYYNSFQNNTWNIQMNANPGGSRGVWTHRDSSSFNRFVGNTVNITGPAQLSFMLTNSGSFGGTTGNNCFSNNVIRDDNPQPGFGMLNWYDGVRNDTLQYNVFMTNSTLPIMMIAPSGTAPDGLILRHNTFWCGGPTAIDFTGASTAIDGARLVSNIFYNATANASGSENVKLPAGFGLDSAGVFFSLGSASASRAIRIGSTDGAPGSGGAYGVAGESAWGSPRFADSTYATFNPTLTASTYAAGAGFPDGFAGAVPFGGGSSDVTPPAAVTNLSSTPLSQSSIRVDWTAPGNDGNTGTASTYDLRVSTTAITSANFTSATAVFPQPTPLAAGSAQSYTLTGLSPATTYYFAIKTKDAAGNWSSLSNVPSGTTPGDTTPPAAIKDLAGQ